MQSSKLYILFLLALLIGFSSCEPYEEEDMEMGALPSAPQIQVTPVPNDGNRFLVNFTNEGYFDWMWDCEGATPPTFKSMSDTIVYARAGEYEIKLHVSEEGGNGTATSSTTVSVAEDLPLLCDGVVSVLTGTCTTQCWTISPAAGSVQVGPVPLSSEWFSSTGIDPAQSNDRYCFSFDSGTFLFDDGGETFSACSGYVSIPGYEHPEGATYFLNPEGGEAQDGAIIELSDDSWLAVEDSGPNYEIISATEAELILSSPINPCPGGGPGYFTITLVAVQ